MSGIGLNLTPSGCTSQDPVQYLTFQFVAWAVPEFLRVDLVRFLKFLLKPCQRLLGARRHVVITVDQRLYPLDGMVEDARVTSSANKARLHQMRTQCLLPSFCRISGAVKAESELSQYAGASLAVFLWQLDADVLLNLRMKICPAHAVYHDLALRARDSRSMIDNQPQCLQWSRRAVERVVPPDRKLSPDQTGSVIRLCGVTLIDVDPSNVRNHQSPPGETSALAHKLQVARSIPFQLLGPFS